MARHLILGSLGCVILFVMAMAFSCGGSNPSGPGGSATPTSTPCSGSSIGTSTITTTSAGSVTLLLLSPFTASANSILQSLAVSIASGGSQYELAVYSNNSGPQSLLARTAASAVTGTGWHGARLISSLSISSGSTYWLGVHTDATFGSSFDGGVGSHATQPVSMFGSLPATFTGLVIAHSMMMCITPPCPPGVPIFMPLPGALYNIQGTTCP